MDNLFLGFKGIAFECDQDGIIKKIIRDDNGLIRKPFSGQSLTTIVADYDIRQSLNFLIEIKKEKAAAGYQLNIRTNDNNHVQLLFFAGVLVEERILVIGSLSKDHTENFYYELMKMNNEHVAMVRKSILENMRNREGQDVGINYFDELTHLNNELVGLQRDLYKKNSELEHMNALKNQFIGMVAHDLRNPLGSFVQIADFFLSGELGPLNDEQRRFMLMLSSSAGGMLALVNDMLDISQIEAGRLQLKLEYQDFIQCIRDNIGIAEILAEKKGIKIVLLTDETKIVIKFDYHKISQTLNNLLTNAVKFSPAKGNIEVSAAKTPTHIKLTVSDQGPGVPKTELSLLFKPFTQTSVQSPTGEKGTGLGLAICRRIIEAHNGTIGAQNNPTGGATFYFTLPIARNT